ncbi:MULTISPECIES: LURP-one-related/scramblase family protein [Streptacidiphilus]|uniref:LURP-one-related/scramblase family protein n=2 Tax=Streptacidiphilus TaxID=228398 RepID=A0ABV6UTY4_9ACTN|nr:LURP-one-related family protein [Streptacidiphilus jeojiense]
MKFLMRDRMFSIGDDHWITTEHGDKAFLVDGKVLRVSDTFELKDPSGVKVAVIKKKIVSVRDAMKIERDGETIATVKKKLFTPFRDKYEAHLDDGREFEIHGNILDHEFDIEDDNGDRVARISRKWFTLRDTYGIDIEDGQDVPLLLCVAVCVDHLQRMEGHGD